jgi:hypothetical protein
LSQPPSLPGLGASCRKRTRPEQHADKRTRLHTGTLSPQARKASGREESLDSEEWGGIDFLSRWRIGLGLSPWRSSR